MDLLQGFDLKYDLGFVNNPKRFNVAISRAQALLVIVGNPIVLNTDFNWAALLWYCVENNGYTGDFNKLKDVHFLFESRFKKTIRNNKFQKS